MPPHTGHQYLVQFAQSYATHLDLFVCSLASEPIPGGLRFAWMNELFPSANVIHITEEIPEASRDQEGAEQIWARSLRGRMDHDPAYVFASESYGLALAAALGAEFVPVDPQRSVFPVSAGMIRDDPFAYWDFIPGAVRPYFARRVVVLGPHDEAVELCQRLATRYRTVAASDYAAFAERADFAVPVITTRADIARGQQASEDALLRNANRFLFSPADPLLVAGESESTGSTRTAPYLVVALAEVPDWYREQTTAQGSQFISEATIAGSEAATCRILDAALTQP